MNDVADRPLVCALLKARDEVVREGNIRRVLADLDRYCDAGVIFDDGSVDGTAEYLQEWLEGKLAVNPQAPWFLLKMSPPGYPFGRELEVKQQMLEIIHEIQPFWVWWCDADEVLEEDASGFRDWARASLDTRMVGFYFNYVQFWRSTDYRRVDGTWPDRKFLKLWRWNPTLAFSVQEGLHRDQYPHNLLQQGTEVGTAPFSVLHYGNAGANLALKIVRYHGLCDVDDHLHFQKAAFEPVDQARIPAYAEHMPGEPKLFTADEEAKILALADMHHLSETFFILIPTFNRAHTLDRALESVLAQTYSRWIAVVMDDGSTDETPALMRAWQDRDPRILYCRYPVNRGTVAIHEIGLGFAVDVASWWTRLGSDDWWGPRKLELDTMAFKAGHRALYGPYASIRPDGVSVGTFNPPMPPELVRARLLGYGPQGRPDFVCSWANIAVTTEILRQVRERHGSFCAKGPRLMEDFSFNARVARLTPFAWRAVTTDGVFILDPSSPVELSGIEPDAAWFVADDGASSRINEVMEENQMTWQAIARENEQWGR